MKRLLFLFLISFSIAIRGYADSSSTIQKSADQISQSETFSNIPDSAKLTFSRVYSDVKTGIAALAASLKVGAEHVYGILVRQQLVISLTWLIFLIISCVMWIPFFKYMPDDEGVKCPYIVFIGGSSFLFTLVSFCHIEMILTGLINPEYGAIKDIISIVK